MWQCKRCKTKNNNNSLKCHGKGCKAIREKDAVISETKQRAEELKIKRSVLDECPKCKKETVFEFVRRAGKYKRYRCTECNSLCNQISRSRQIAEPFAKLGGGHDY